VKIKLKLETSVLLASSGLFALALPTAVQAGPGAAVVSVRATVSPTVVMKFESGSTKLSVTEEDIARGYIDVPGASRLTLNSDRSAQQLANLSIDYEPNASGFSSVQLATRTLPAGERNSDTTFAGIINALPATASGRSSDDAREDAQGDTRSKAGDEGAEPGRVRGSVTSLGYRLTLPKGIKPGDISVPLTLNLQL
jgi:hypothetical protein